MKKDWEKYHYDIYICVCVYICIYNPITHSFPMVRFCDVLSVKLPKGMMPVAFNQL